MHILKLFAGAAAIAIIVAAFGLIGGLVAVGIWWGVSAMMKRSEPATEKKIPPS